MRSYNRTFLIGNCAAEPVLAETKNGKNYMYFPLAVERGYKNPETESNEVDFHRIVQWGEVSEKLLPMVKKGTRLFVTGKMLNYKYEGATETKYITEIHATQIEVLSFNQSIDKKTTTKEKELVNA
jgi:single-strand DNA-binding protein